MHDHLHHGQLEDCYGCQVTRLTVIALSRRTGAKVVLRYDPKTVEALGLDQTEYELS